MTVVNCATGSLAPFVPNAMMPWDIRRIAHLHRRLGYGITEMDRMTALSEDPQSHIDNLLDTAANAPLSPQPNWGYWTYQDYSDYDSSREPQLQEMWLNWFEDLIDNPIRGKLSVFWHNHFVTEQESYDCPPYLYQYHRKIQEHVFGNFKEFVREIGLEPAMLIYLNGAENTKENPNENYARELYELFTMGADNGYTQTDIEETSRALTGYNNFSDYCGTINFFPFNFDGGNKTIFGQTGNWGYNDVIEILFDQRASEIAHFICGKLYQSFVHPEINEEVVGGLANTFLANNFELLPVYQQLFKSEHFFDDKVLNTVVKDPLEIILISAKEIGFEMGTTSRKLEWFYYAAYLGQFLSNPINVAGWSGNRSWVSNAWLTIRWDVVAYQAYLTHEDNAQRLVDIALNLVGGDANTNSPELVVQNVIDYFIPGGLQDQTHYDRATIVFKADIPENYYTNGQWNLNWDTIEWQMLLLLGYIGKMPEMQLM